MPIGAIRTIPPICTRTEWNALVNYGLLNPGTSFPFGPQTGQLFYRSDLNSIYYFNGASWNIVTGTGSAPQTGSNVFSDLYTEDFFVTGVSTYKDTGNVLINGVPTNVTGSTGDYVYVFCTVRSPYDHISKLSDPMFTINQALLVEKDMQTFGFFGTASDPYKGAGGGAVLMGQGFTGLYCPPLFDLTGTLPSTNVLGGYQSGSSLPAIGTSQGSQWFYNYTNKTLYQSGSGTWQSMFTDVSSSEYDTLFLTRALPFGPANLYLQDINANQLTIRGTPSTATAKFTQGITNGIRYLIPDGTNETWGLGSQNHYLAFVNTADVFTNRLMPLDNSWITVSTALNISGSDMVVYRPVNGSLANKDSLRIQTPADGGLIVEQTLAANSLSISTNAGIGGTLSVGTGDSLITFSSGYSAPYAYFYTTANNVGLGTTAYPFKWGDFYDLFAQNSLNVGTGTSAINLTTGITAGIRYFIFGGSNETVGLGSTGHYLAFINTADTFTNRLMPLDNSWITLNSPLHLSGSDVVFYRPTNGTLANKNSIRIQTPSDGALIVEQTLACNTLIISTGSGQPIGVNSSTLCTNLNADLLDGQHASNFVTVSNLTGDIISNSYLGTGSAGALKAGEVGHVDFSVSWDGSDNVDLTSFYGNLNLNTLSSKKVYINSPTLEASGSFLSRGLSQIATDGAGPDTSAYGSFGVTRLADSANNSYIAMTKQSTWVWGLGIDASSNFIIGSPVAGRTITTPNLFITPAGDLYISRAITAYNSIYSYTSSIDSYINAVTTTNNQTGFHLQRNQGGGGFNYDWYMYVPSNTTTLYLYGGGANRLSLDTSGNMGVLGYIQFNNSPKLTYSNTNTLSVEDSSGDVHGGALDTGYLLCDYIQALSSAVTINSTLAFGNNPFTISNTNKISNLNADMVDGYHVGSFITTGDDIIVNSVLGTGSASALKAGTVGHVDFAVSWDGSYNVGLDTFYGDMNLNTPSGKGVYVQRGLDIGTTLTLASAAGTSGQYLKSNGVGNAPTWGSITCAITGVDTVPFTLLSQTLYLNSSNWSMDVSGNLTVSKNLIVSGYENFGSGYSAPGANIVVAGTRFNLYGADNNYQIGLEGGGIWFKSVSQFRWYNSTPTALMSLDSAGALSLIGGITTTNGSITANSDVNTWVSSITTGNYDSGLLLQRVGGSYNSIWKIYTPNTSKDFRVSVDNVDKLTLETTGKLTTTGELSHPAIISLTNSDKMLTRDEFTGSLYNRTVIGGGTGTGINQYIKFANPSTNISAYLFTVGLSDGANEPILYWDRGAAFYKDVVAGGRLDSMEGIISLAGGIVGWGPTTGNPFIWLNGNYYNHPELDRLEIRRYTTGWVWGDLQCGTSYMNSASFGSGVGDLIINNNLTVGSNAVTSIVDIGVSHSGIANFELNSTNGGTAYNLRLNNALKLTLGFNGANSFLSDASGGSLVLDSLNGGDIVLYAGGSNSGNVRLWGGKYLLPQTAQVGGSGGIGSHTGYYFYEGSFYNLWIKNYASLDEYDDLELVKQWGELKPKLSEKYDVEKIAPPKHDIFQILRTDEKGEVSTDLYNGNRLHSFALGCAKALAKKQDEHDTILLALQEKIDVLESKIQDLESK